MSRAPLRYASVCSGIEAPSVAWHPLGWSPVFFSEIEAFPCAVLKHHYPDVPNLGDMTKIDGAAWRGKVDVLIGGTPCQAFSVAGKRGSLDDARGNLSLTFCELVHGIDPLCVVWENVPGVLSVKDNAFGCFLAGLVGEESGPFVSRDGSWPVAGMVAGPRRTAAWRVLNAEYFGLAQRRRRVFVVSFRTGDGINPGAVLFEPESVRRNLAPSREAGARVAGTLKACAGKSGTANGAEEVDRLIHYTQEVVTNALDAHMGMGGPDDNAAQANHLIASRERERELPAVSLCLNAGGMGRLDLETETLIPVTGGFFDQPTHALKAEGFDASEDGTGRGVPIIPEVYPCLRGGNQYNNSDPGMEASMLIPSPVAYQCHGSNVGPMGTVRAGNGNETGGVPFVFQTRIARNGRGQPEEIAPTLSGAGADETSDMRPCVSDAMGVRRLTPAECESLQGFPRGYTLVTYRGKPAADGPRYRAIGNSMATTVIQWLGVRVNKVLAAHESREAVSA